MNIYFAPMEGITGYIFRNAYEACFGGSIDKYFAPFVTASERKELSTKEIKDLSPENNTSLTLVPQILGNHADAFVHTVERIVDMGYQEINLNLGCPSKTVVTKKKGAGLLAYPQMLEEYLEGVFTYAEKHNISISVKTRIGMSEESEFAKLLAIYNQYPISEFILHPRTQEDYYQKPVRPSAYEYALENAKASLVYNGDLSDLQKYRTFCETYPSQGTVMIGRGLLTWPGFTGIDEGLSFHGSGKEEKFNNIMQNSKDAIWQLHDAVYTGYLENLQGYQNILFKMKELWSYFQVGFMESCGENQQRAFEKQIKELRKVKDQNGYDSVIQRIKQL